MAGFEAQQTRFRLPDTVLLRQSVVDGERSTSLDFPREPRTYGQTRGVMPFSCAYLAADVSTRGRTNA
jgi:hypothetical protein